MLLTVADQSADANPRVIAAARAADHARQQLRDLTEQHADARAALSQTIAAGQRPSDPQARATQSRARADHARRPLAQIDALPASDAAQLIHDRQAQATTERIAGEAASRARATEPAPRRPPAPVHQPGPDRGLGPSL